LAAEGELDVVRERHAAFYISSAKLDEPSIGAGRPARVDALEREEANLRATLAWAIDQGKIETGLRLAEHLITNLWVIRGRFHESRLWARRVLAIADDAEIPRCVAIVTLL